MQGTLNEIDIRSILQLIELGQRTGELLIEAHQTSLGKASYSSQVGTIDSPKVFWLVFSSTGKLFIPPIAKIEGVVGYGTIYPVITSILSQKTWKKYKGSLITKLN
uniref:DUF4388 domain-containing protein n=1 Tax=Crocosphaera watsonii TaxID=263511 RepID=UPI0006505B3D